MVRLRLVKKVFRKKLYEESITQTQSRVRTKRSCHIETADVGYTGRIHKPHCSRTCEKTHLLKQLKFQNHTPGVRSNAPVGDP